MDELKQPGAGGLLILEIETYQDALEIIKKDTMIKNDLVEWKLNEWIDISKEVIKLFWKLFHEFLNLFRMITTSSQRGTDNLHKT